MGYLLVAHVTKLAPDTQALASLPPSIGWSVHHQGGTEAFYIDTYRAGEAQEWPFTSMPPTNDLPLDFAPGLESLSVLYRALEEVRLADSFKRGFLNLNLALSKALQMPVCSFCSDDDGVDFACESEGGQLKRLHCECGDLDIIYRDGKVVVQPLLGEDGESTDLSGLIDPESGLVVRERNVEQSTMLHSVASMEVSAFLGVKTAPIGLGSFDGLESLPPKVSSSVVPRNAPERARKKPWWQFW